VAKRGAASPCRRREIQAAPDRTQLPRAALQTQHENVTASRQIWLWLESRRPAVVLSRARLFFESVRQMFRCKSVAQFFVNVKLSGWRRYFKHAVCAIPLRKNL